MLCDANFAADDRLRLTSFLRVVKYGIPERPARFKRHHRNAAQQPHTSRSNSLARSDSLFTSIAVQRPCASNDNTLNQSNRACALAKGQPFPDMKILQEQENLAPECKRSLSSNFKSPSLDNSTASHVFHLGDQDCIVGQDQDTESVYLQQCLSETEKFTEKPPVVCNSERKFWPNSRTSLETSKKCLPLNELQLLRTTTVDGLPDPHNISRAFALPVTERDPIEETDMNPRIPEDHTISLKERTQLSYVAQTSQIVDDIGSKTTSTVKGHMPKRSSNKIQRLPIWFESGRDGFIESELIVGQGCKPRRRVKVAVPEGKKIVVVRGLMLAGGFLPPPTTEAFEIPKAFRVHKHNDARKKYEHNREKVIRNQLSQVTAPARHHSSSSGSALENEQE